MIYVLEKELHAICCVSCIVTCVGAGYTTFEVLVPPTCLAQHFVIYSFDLQVIQVNPADPGEALTSKLVNSV